VAEPQVTSEEIQITAGKSVKFQSQKVKDDFLKGVGKGWEKVVRDVLRRQPDGTYEVFPGDDAEESVIGSVPLDSDGDYYIKAHSGICRDAFLAAVPQQFIHHISARLAEIFGDEGMEGTPKEYAWFEKTYGITEEEDNKFLDLVEFYEGSLVDQPSFSALTDGERDEVLKFVNDKEQHFAFLKALSKKVDRSCKTYPKACRASP
jgi:hypothetical protein